MYPCWGFIMASICPMERPFHKKIKKHEIFLQDFASNQDISIEKGYGDGKGIPE